MGHPRRNRVCRRTEDDFDASLAHGVHDAIHPGVVELAVFGLPEAPGGLAHAHNVEAGGLHERNILFKPDALGIGRVLRHVLVVVGDSVEHSGKAEVRVAVCGLCACEGDQCEESDDSEEKKARRTSLHSPTFLKKRKDHQNTSTGR